jgi:hypothetical protein
VNPFGLLLYIKTLSGCLHSDFPFRNNSHSTMGPHKSQALFLIIF